MDFQSSRILAATLRGVSAVALAAGTVGLAAPAFAQSAEAPASAKKADNARGNDEEIVVTGSYTTGEALDSATGLGLTILETPQSVTVMTAQRMEDQAIRTLSDVINNAAGVSAKAFDSARNGFSARGFEIDSYQIDGVPLQWESPYAAGESLIDVALYERVEIVRGATGLMTGAGNPSASINLIRKHADSDSLTGSLTATAARWDSYSVMGDISTPLTANGAIRARLVGKYEEGDSFVDLLHDKKLVLYGVIDADLSPTTRLSFGASYQDNDPKGTQWGGLPVWYADGSRTDWKRSKTVGADWTRWATTNQTYFGDLTQQLGDNWSIKLYGSYSVNESRMRLLYLSGSPDEVTGLGMGAFAARYDGKLTQFDAGVRVNGKYQLFGREHELIVGASYAKQDLDFYSYAAEPGTVDPVGDFNAWDGSYRQPTWGARGQDVDQKTKQWGYFAATRLSLADPLMVIVGGRLASWERKGIAYGTVADFGDKNRFLPYAGVLFDLAPNHTIYASYTEIFQPQNSQDRNGDFLPPVTGVNYEAGLKSSFFDGKLTTAISVFKIKQDNLAQADVGYLVPGTINQAYYAAKGAKSTGFEVEANGEILPGWAVSMNYTQFKAEDADGNGVNTLFPDKLLRLFTTYNFQGSLDGLTIGGGVNWEGLSYTDTVNPKTGADERLKVKNYAVVNLMTRYQITDRASVQINAENIFDKKYYSQIGFYNQLAYGEPRNVTLTLRYQF